MHIYMPTYVELYLKTMCQVWVRVRVRGIELL